MRSGRSYGQRQSDTLESSFELEDSEAEQVNSPVAIKGEPSAHGDTDRDGDADRERQESGEQTDSLSTRSSSSTPTTADVADVETISSLPLSPPAFGGRGNQLVKRHSPLKDKQVEQADSSSSSSCSQQPDADDVPTVSGCDLRQSPPSSSSSSSSTSTSPQTSRYAAAAAHPSAAFAETAITASSGSGRVCGGSGGAAHRRTHSAASYISMRSQGGNSEATPERPKRNRFFEWIRVVCNICCCKVFHKKHTLFS